MHFSIDDTQDKCSIKPLLLNIVVVAGLFMMASPMLAFAADTDKSEDKVSRTQVTTAIATTADWTVSIPAQGEILPWEVAIISAKTNGIGATEINVVEGDSVRKGQVLARFDDRLLRAELAQAKANLALAESNLQLATSNLKRVEKLKIKQTLSEQEFQQVSTQSATATATRDQAAAAVSLAQIKLADATVVATDDGKILERNIELGKVPGSGEALFRLLRQHKLEWVVQIDAADLGRVKPTMLAQVQVADKTLTGTIRSVSPQLTSNSRLAKIRVVLDGAPEVAVNTYAAGKILVGNAQATILPADTLVIKDGKTWIFRVKNNTAEQVLVTLGRRLGQEIEILSGINSGDVVVLEGAGFLNDGDKLAANPSTISGANQ
jgi:RND family efflux transporter MFP subunit